MAFMEAKHQPKQSKAAFERYLSERIGNQTLQRDKIADVNHETGHYTVLWCYYNTNGHIGTWVNRACWVFEDEELWENEQ
jgi:hypothetical protein